MNTVSDDDTGDKRRRRWRRLAVIAAVAVLAVVLLVAGGVLLGLGTGTTAAPARVTPAPVPVASSAVAASTAQGSSSPTLSSAPAVSASDACPLGLVSDVLPASAPADVVWRATPMAPVPYSKTWGPYRTTASGLPRCFSHSPTGAVIAVRQIDAWLFSTQWRTVLATQVARTPGYIGLRSALESQPPDGSADTNTVVGFDIETYTPAAATIALVLRGPNNTGPSGCPLAVQWVNGDWQVTPRPDGTLTEASCPLVDTGTYIPWGPYK